MHTITKAHNNTYYEHYVYLQACHHKICKCFIHILLTPNSLKLYFHYTLCQHLLPMHNISYIVFKSLNKGKSHPLHMFTNSFLLNTCTHRFLRVKPLYSCSTDYTQLCFLNLLPILQPSQCCLLIRNPVK